MLNATGLGKRFGSRWIFRGIDLCLQPGDCLVVRGRNGSGKSTLLKVLAGLMAPSEGTVQRPEPLGYAALDLSVYPALTGLEHLELARDLRGDPVPPLESLARVGLTDAAHQVAGAYSSGMRARLKLALALACQPALLLLDEPSAALDDAGRAITAQALVDQRTRGVALLATNDDRDQEWATHALVLDR